MIELTLIDLRFARSPRRPVPAAMIGRLLVRWKEPDRTEAHQVDWIIR